MACSLNEPAFCSANEYYAGLLSLLTRGECELVVLPAHSALLFAERCGLLGSPESFFSAFSAYLKCCAELTPRFLEVHTELARSAGVFLVPGTFLEIDGANCYHSSALIGPNGEICGRQRQTHLSREERAAGLSRGAELRTFSTPSGTAGLVVGSDAWYPEVSRILGLQGTDIACHPGSIPESFSPHYQLCGMWKEVQQNQFFGIESQLSPTVGGENFQGRCAIHAPCEMTEDKSGYLALSSNKEGPAVSAFLDFQARRKAIREYPLYAFLNPPAYRRYLPSLYPSAGKEKE